MTVTDAASLDDPPGVERRSERAGRVWLSVGAIAGGAVVAVLVLWDFGLRPLRTALPSRLFSQFFDLQAEALLDGRLDVPAGTLGLEAFVHDGREYLYFGLFPALLRLPVAALTDQWFGRWTAPSMLLGWIVFAVVTSVLVWRVRAFTRPGMPLGRFEATLTFAFVLSAVGGSSVLLLLALPWVYSEALMWAVAAAMAVLFFLLGVIERPSVARVAVLAVAATAAALTRVTTAWAAGLTVVGVGLWFLWSSEGRPRRPWAPAVLAAGAVPLAVAIAVNWAKFRHPWAIPFDDQVFTSLSSQRRQVLDEGGVSGIRFLPSTLASYFRPDGVRFSPVFPYITPPGEPASSIGAALDMRYRTPSLVATMPFLALLAAIGLVRAVRPGTMPGIRRLRLPLLGALALPGGVLLVGYIHPRYLAEFLPGLILAGAIGIAAVDELVRPWTRRARAVAASVLGLLLAFGLAANVAMAVASARTRAGGEDLAAFVRAQHAVSDLTGGPLDGWIETGPRLPARSRPDRIFIVGDCDGSFAGTGDRYDPWVPFDVPDQQIEIDMGGRRPSDLPAARVPLMDFTAGGFGIELRLDGQGNFKLVAVGADNGFYEGAWTPIAAEAVALSITTDTLREEILIDAPGHLYTGIPAVIRGQDLLARPVVATPASAIDRDGVRLGIELRRSVPASSLCRRLLEAAS